MRRAFRRHSREEEEESAFVSMTDMTVSFLFILMILLAYFASQFNPAETVLKSVYDEAVKTIEEQKRLIAELSKPDPLETYIAQTASERRNILERLRERLLAEFPDLNVVISAENDALRFQGDGWFDSSSAAFRNQQTALVVQRIAMRLNEILPCYTFGRLASWSKECNPNGAIIEAVQIEGHTDSSGIFINNLRLSTERAITTFAEMQGVQPHLIEHLNHRQQPVLSVAGYGPMRPIAGNASPEERATNRRIDLRIIMFTPGTTAEIERIQDRLQAAVGQKSP